MSLCSLFRETQTAALPPVQNFSYLSLVLLHPPKVHKILRRTYPRHNSNSMKIRRHQTEHEHRLKGWGRQQVRQRRKAQRECAILPKNEKWTCLLSCFNCKKFLKAYVHQQRNHSHCSLNSAIILFVQSKTARELHKIYGNNCNVPQMFLALKAPQILQMSSGDSKLWTLPVTQTPLLWTESISQYLPSS